MIILTVLLWLIIFLFTFLVLLLLLNIRVSLQGYWREQWKYTLQLGLGPLFLGASPTSEGQQEITIKLNNWVVYRKQKNQASEPKPVQRDKPSFKELRPFLRGEFLQKVISTLLTVYNRVQDREFWLRGAWGFSDPYYTGLLAACSALMPGLEVEPVFSGPYRDVELRIGGRLRLGILVYYLLKLFVSREARGVWREMREQKKTKNFRKDATPWKKAVYSTVKQ